MNLTTAIIDTSPAYLRMCEASIAVQEMYNPDRFSFLVANSIIFPDWNREIYEYRSYERYTRCHVFTSLNTRANEFWTAVWVPTPGELVEMLTEAMAKKRVKSKPKLELSEPCTYDVIKAVERHAFECDAKCSMSMVMLLLLEKFVGKD
jgi:hypothetical protein